MTRIEERSKNMTESIMKRRQAGLLSRKQGAKARMPKKQGTSIANKEYKKLKEHYRKHAN